MCFFRLHWAPPSLELTTTRNIHLNVCGVSFKTLDIFVSQKKPCIISGVTRRYFTADDRFQSQVCPYGICCEGTGIGAWFSPRALGDTGMHIPVPVQYSPISMPVLMLESSCNVMAHSDAREGKWRGNWRMKWVASTLHTTSKHGVSSVTTADAHTSAARSRLNWCVRRFKWTCPFRRKTKSGFCACAITFQTQST